jgi:hypothetical protein
MSKLAYSPEPPFATGCQPDPATEAALQSYAQRAAQRQRIVEGSVAKQQPHPVSKRIFRFRPQESLIRPQTGSPSHCPDSERFSCSSSAEAQERMRRLERHAQHEVTYLGFWIALKLMYCLQSCLKCTACREGAGSQSAGGHHKEAAAAVAAGAGCSSAGAGAAGTER